MKEEPKSVWKKTLKGPRGFWACFILLTTATFLIFLSFGYELVMTRPVGRLVILSFLYALGLGLAGTLVIVFFRWVWCWQNFKRFLFGCACVATLIAMLYAEEDWWGKHDWDAFKREWEAKGETFGWQTVIPPPVTDDQNFAMSPVWIAEEKYNFQNEPKRAEAWYGNRIYREDVLKYTRLMPFTAAALVGTNWTHWSSLPSTPETSPSWQIGRMTDLRPWQSYYRTTQEKIPAADISITPQPQSPAADVLLALSKYDPLIKQLQQDSPLPYSRFPVQYDTEPPYDILLPHLSGLKECAQVLQLGAVAELQNGQTDKAFDDVKLALRVTDAIHTEQFAVSQVLRVAVLNLALQPIWEGLAHQRWSDAQLAELDSALARFDFLSDYKTAIRGERGLQNGGFDYLRRYPEGLLNFASGDFTNKKPPFPTRLVCQLVPTGWIYQNELCICRSYTERYLEVVDVSQRRVSPSAVRSADEAAEAEERHVGPYNFIARAISARFGKFAERMSHGQSATDMARVAIALERYRLAHGEFPESLDALTPQFMQQVPHDIITGEPLHYRRTPDGQFVLYSVGWNETDDGGVVIFKKSTKNETSDDVDVDQGDWVWRYPEK
jgi:hypothetical protein